MGKNNELHAIGNLSSYIYSMLGNAAKDHFKKGSSEPIEDMDFEDKNAQIEDQILNNEMSEIIHEAINELDDKSKYIFIETEINGRGYKEISEELGIPIGTLLSRKSRATKKLRKFLSEYTERKGKHVDDIS